MLTSTCLAILALALPPATPAQTTWTVAADGSGDFLQIQQAIDVAADGDVVAVKAGTYAPFLAEKRLTIVGPEFTGFVPTAQVNGASAVRNTDGFTLAGLLFGSLVLSDIAGPVTIDECRLTAASLSGGAQPTLDVVRVDGLLLSRTTVIGPTGDHGFNPVNAPGWAVRVRDGALVVEGSTLIGGDGNDPATCDGISSTGGPALELRYVDASIVGSVLRGGNGDSVCCLCACCFDEAGGIPLRTLGGRVLFLGGVQLVQPPGDSGLGSLVDANDTELVWSTANPPSDVVLKGASSFTATSGGVWLTIPGSDTPGQTRSVRVEAPAGALGLLVLGSAAAPGALTGFAPELWISSGAPLFLVPIVGTGVSSPVLDVTLPTSPSLIGTHFQCQAAFPTVASPLDGSSGSLSNPAPLLLRF